MKTRQILVLLTIALMMVAGKTGQAQESNETTGAPENGIYLVQRWTVDRDDLFPLFENEVFFEYDESKYIELRDEEAEPVKFIALSQTEFIPFDLEQPPVMKKREDGFKLVSLTFSAEMTEKMKSFSRQFLGRQVATVVDGNIITLHKVRSVIDGGRLQITRCTDDGCELILGQLSDK